MAYRGGDQTMTDSAPGPTFRIWSQDGLPVVTPPDEIDHENAGQLLEALNSAGSGHATIIVDMTATQVCDSSGIQALVLALKRAQAGGGELRLVMGLPAVRRIFKVTGVDRLVRIFVTLPEAVAAQPRTPSPQAE
jgi:anti-sigma B factor antagonist